MGFKFAQLFAGKEFCLVNATRNVMLARRLRLALSPLARARGLIAGSPLAADEGMLLAPCRGVHTFFMGFSIDVAFLDAQGAVVGICPDLRPWRMSKTFWHARAAVELCVGALKRTRTQVGDRVVFEPIQ